MAKINAINNKSEELTIDPVTGDSFIQYDIGGVGEFRTGVDDTDDSYRISQGSALGTNDTFIMTAAGERTMPLQAAFLAYVSSTDTNQTGDNTATIQCDTEVFDQNGDYNNGTYTFTAPRTGKYKLFGGFVITDITASNRVFLKFHTSNRTYSLASLSPIGVKTASDRVGITATALTDMDAADTATLEVRCSGEGGNTIDIVGGTPLQSFFGGYLAC